MIYDAKSLELAEWFLDDEPITPEQKKVMADKLARHIQYEVETWLMYDDDGPGAIKVPEVPHA